MASFVTPKKNTAYECYVALVSQANTKIVQISPTMAAGDVKVSTDNGTSSNITTLPVIGTNTRVLKVNLSAAEMNGNNVTVIFSDAAGAEWCDLVLNIQTSARQIDDLATPTNITAGTIATVSGNVNGSVGSVAGAVGSVTGAVGSVTGNVGGNVVGSVASVVGAVGSVTGLTASNLDTTISSRASAANLAIVAGYVDTEIADIQARLPAALVGGRMDSSVGAIGNDTTALTAFKRAVLANVIGTVGAASTTTSIVTSSLLPAAAVIDQFKGRIVIFDKDTTTANLRGQGTDITGNTALGVLTVTALTDAPVSGDTFTIT